MAPHISKRESIRWLPYPGVATEPTSTLVVTSAQNRFVDIRVTDPGLKGGEMVLKIGGEVLPKKNLDWAFAGTCTTSLRSVPTAGSNSPTSPSKERKENAGQVFHTIFNHWLDSRYPDAEAVKDEGDMYPDVQDRDSKRTFERGRMMNPVSGRVSEYEECWLEIPLATAAAMRKAPALLDGGKGEQWEYLWEPDGPDTPSESDKLDGVTNVVLTLSSPHHNARGMVVRVGQACQGVLRVGEMFAAERWQWRAESGWTRVVRIGDLYLPCGPAMEETKLGEGGRVRYGEYLWEIVELGVA